MLGKKKVELFALSAQLTIPMFISGTNSLTAEAATPAASTSCQLILLKITSKIHAKEV